MCNKGGRLHGSDGFILVAVLGVLALLAGFFVTLSFGLRTGVDTAALASENLAADALLQAGTELAGYQLFALNRPPDAVDGQEIRLDGGVVSLSVRSEAGKVDLNGSDLVLLAAAYRAAGLVGLSPERFAARVADWRDEDAEESDGGAEAPAYAAAGLGFAPRNGAFHSVDDLKWVLGVRAPDIDALRPFLTAYNPGGQLDIRAAPVDLIRHLPGLGPVGIEAMLAARRSPDASRTAALASLLGDQAEFLTAEPIPVYEVGIVARVNRSALSRHVRLVMINSNQVSSPYWVVSRSGDR